VRNKHAETAPSRIVTEHRTYRRLLKKVSAVPKPKPDRHLKPTVEQEARILMMVKFNSSQCAEAVGVSQAMVLRVRRAARPSEVVPPPVMAKPAPAIELFRQLAVVPQPRKPPPVPVSFKSACCWPLGNRTSVYHTFHYCDGPVVPNKPYCKAHCDVAYKKRGDRDEAPAPAPTLMAAE
jgi:hypothetical protein